MYRSSIRAMSLGAGLLALAALLAPLRAADQSLTDKLLKDVSAGAANDVQKDLAGGADANAKTSFGFPFLSIAASSDKAAAGAIATLLIEHGAVVDAKDNSGWTALTFAASSGHIETARVLLDHKADPNVRNSNGQTPLISAAMDGRTDMARLLIEHGADVNAKDNSGNTAIFNAAYAGHPDVLRLLLEHGADVNAKSNDGLTAWDEANHYNHVGDNPEVIALLGGHGARPGWASNPKDLNDHLTTDVSLGKPDDVKSDIAFGADANARDDSGNPALIIGVMHGYADMAGMLLDHGADVNAKDKDGNTALIMVAMQDRADIIRLLLDHGADVNAKNNDGVSALTMAVSKHQIEVAKLLLDRGADVNAAANDGETALFAVAADPADNAAMAQLLLDHGADASLRDKAGKSALDHADPFSKVANLLTGSSHPQQAVAADASRYFQRLFYTPTNGKAGYHMISKIQAYLDDIPDNCGPFSPTGELSVDGTLPPGIALPQHKTYLEGTPQEPGDWEVTVHFPGVYCTQGGSVSYGDRDIKVHFHIDGDAAKSVDQLQ